jgi:hypothetical protein
MLKKMGLVRRKAFLKALAETDNVTLAAERAKVSRSWVLKARKAEAAFDAACEEAVRQSFGRLAGQESNRPARRGWGHLDGMELVVRGSNRRRVQIARARPGQFSPRTEDRFLAVLAATGSVKAAYGAAGMSKSAAYSHRKRWPGFAARWDAAIADSEVRLEFALVNALGANPFSAEEPPEAAAVPPMHPEEMLHSLRMNQYRLHGLGKRPGRRGRPPTIEAVTDKLIRAVDAIERGRALSEDVKAGDRRERDGRRG